jgi:hypothetical protein
MIQSDLLAENARLKARVKQLERMLGMTLISHQHIIHGRPAVTLAQAAQERSVPYYTARRRCEDGTWDAVQVRGDGHKPGAPSYGRWWVFVDVPPLRMVPEARAA